MDCPQTEWLSNSEYLSAFRRRTYLERIPLSGGINLTNQCNLKCVHCYIRDYKGKDGCSKNLPAERILGIIEEAAQAGCLFFLITGGEPLLHPDFCAIYEHARRLGMLVSVFTNGTLLNQTHVDLFKKLPPHHLEITLYGGTEETFDRVAGQQGAYRACHKGIQLLVDGGITFRLKTMLLTLNLHEIDMMKDFARQVNAKFRLDPMIGPTLDGDTSPLQYRISPEQGVALEMSDPQQARKRAEYSKVIREPYRQEYLYRCGTGTTAFFLNAFGGLQPCLMVSDNSVDVRESSFNEAWQKLAEIRDIKASADSPCRTCEDLPYCGYCPPTMELENGMKVGPDNFMCKLGRFRHQAALNTLERT